jgi:hypothetical protein
MRFNLIRTASVTFFFLILTVSAYQFAQPTSARLCTIERNCQSKCNYCLSVKGANDPACSGYEDYADLNQCYRDCDVSCAIQSCTASDGYQTCNFYCDSACWSVADSRCQAAGASYGEVVGHSCSTANSSCGTCTCNLLCHY